MVWTNCDGVLLKSAPSWNDRKLVGHLRLFNVLMSSS